jgi:tetratricopeptide (TPR) repeat protein
VGHTEEALQTLERGLELYPDNGNIRLMRPVLLAADGRYAIADSLLADAGRDHRDPNLEKARLTMQTALDAVRGRVREAFVHARELERESVALGTGEALRSAVWSAGLRLALLADTAGAIRQVEAALARYPLADMAPLQRPYLDLASFHARVGRADRAREVLHEREQAIPGHERGSERADELSVELLLALADGDLERPDAILDERDDVAYCDVCQLDLLAAAHADAGNTARAIALYERFLGTRWAWRTADSDAEGLGHALLRLAALYEDAGDLEAAARNYARFVELWQDADPELQPRVTDARARLQRIVGRRG